MTYVWVALGGALGSMARHSCTSLAARWIGTGFPWGTLAVNVIGSFVIGVLAALLTTDGRPLISGDARAFLFVGIIGGFTTFSAFSLDTLSLARTGAWATAAANVALSVVLCLAAVCIGHASAAVFNR